MEHEKLNPKSHHINRRYLLKNDYLLGSIVSEGILIEWSKLGNAKIRWVNNPNSSWWILSEELPFVIEDLGAYIPNVIGTNENEVPILRDIINAKSL